MLSLFQIHFKLIPNPFQVDTSLLAPKKKVKCETNKLVLQPFKKIIVSTDIVRFFILNVVNKTDFSSFINVTTKDVSKVLKIPSFKDSRFQGFPVLKIPRSYF